MTATTLLACRGASNRTDSATTVAAVDSGRIVVAGPTLVVFFAHPLAAIDSGGETAEVMSDLQYHLGSARPSLDSAGVTIVERYDDTVEYALDGVVHRFWPPRDSAYVGYLFLAPRARPRTHYGVMTDLGLAETARAQLGLPPATGRR